MNSPSERPPITEPQHLPLGNEVEIVRFQPEGNDGTQLPVYFGGGVGYGPGNGKAETVLKAIAQHGREAWGLERTVLSAVDGRFEVTKDGRTTIGDRALAWRSLADQATSRVVSLHQNSAAEDLITGMSKAGIERTDAIFQSADALNGLIAASEHPERFNNIILAFPGGQVRRPRPLRNMKSMAKETVADKLSGAGRAEMTIITPQETTDETKRKRAKFARYAGQSVMGIAATHSYQGDMLTSLRQSEQRPGVALVVGLRDWMIRYDDLFDSLGSAEDVDYVMVVDSGHGIKDRQDVLDDMLALLPKLEQVKQQSDHKAKPLRDRLILPDHLSSNRKESIRVMADNVPS